MRTQYWLPILLALACLPAFPVRGQLLSDPSSLRHTLAAQVEWAEGLGSARREAALRLLAVAEEILALPDGEVWERTRLLAEAQGLADQVASLEEERAEALTMVRETRAQLMGILESRRAALLQALPEAPPDRRPALETQARELGDELEALRVEEETAEEPGGPAEPLESASGVLSALARVVAEEHQRLAALQSVQEEQRLFMGDLSLFDETAMPPSARSGEGGSHDPGCPPVACPVAGGSPADLPMAMVQREEGVSGTGAAATTPASLARLYGQIRARTPVPELPVREETRVTRQVALGTGVTAFRGDGDESLVPGPKLSGALVFSRPLAEGLGVGLTVEPSVGGQALRSGQSVFTELVGEVRETLTGNPSTGGPQWLVTSWQKGRFLSDPLPAPGYLEPGRVEGGLAGRLTLPFRIRWSMEAEGGADGVRYEPEDWKVLDRQGVNGALGLAWRGNARAARVSLRASHHGFSDLAAQGLSGRRDTRVALEADGFLEGSWVARLTLGGAWNQSRIEAYDFRSVRAVLLLSAPWGRGSLQGYAAFAHQVYLNPGPEDARVAPSDQDSGAILSLQYALPLGARRNLLLRGGWSRSQTGFREDFYERFGVSAHLAFRGS